MTPATDADSQGRPSRTITRIFDAPRTVVFKVWTLPEYVSQWWGISRSTNPVCELDVRPGGQWRIDMRTAEGIVYPNQGRYLEVVENERIVYTHEVDGNLEIWRGTPPPDCTHTVIFEDYDRGRRTKVTIGITVSSDADIDRILMLGMERGIGEGLDRLVNLLRDPGQFGLQLPVADEQGSPTGGSHG